jgi:predicted nucleic acid-binding OB-fold protein
MKYEDLVNVVDKFEQEIDLTECIYFGALIKLENVQQDLGKLDDVQHIRRVIKPFLVQWGMMGRVVGREKLEWEKLGKTLRSLEKEFKKLRGKRFLTVDFDEFLSGSITTIYRELDDIPYIGSPTAISKILHLLNPEIFVMWDNDIRKNYKKKNKHIHDTPEGYLEFLKQTQKELKEAFEERQKQTGKNFDEIEKEIRGRYKNKTLARIIDEYNWPKAHPNFLANLI